LTGTDLGKKGGVQDIICFILVWLTKQREQPSLLHIGRGFIGQVGGLLLLGFGAVALAAACSHVAGGTTDSSSVPCWPPCSIDMHQYTH